MRTPAPYRKRKWRAWYIGLWVSGVFVLFAVVTTLQSTGFSSVPVNATPVPSLPEATRGEIVGHVLSNTGKPVAGLQIVVMREGGAALWARGVVTDASGRFVLRDVEPGRYVVLPPERTLRRFAPGEYRLLVDVGEVDRVEFRQEPAPPRTYWQRGPTKRAVWG